MLPSDSNQSSRHGPCDEAPELPGQGLAAPQALHAVQHPLGNLHAGSRRSV